MDYAKENRIPFILYIGDDEVKNKQVKIKVK